MGNPYNVKTTTFIAGGDLTGVAVNRLLSKNTDGQVVLNTTEGGYVVGTVRAKVKEGVAGAPVAGVHLRLSEQIEVEAAAMIPKGTYCRSNNAGQAVAIAGATPANNMNDAGANTHVFGRATERAAAAGAVIVFDVVDQWVAA